MLNEKEVGVHSNCNEVSYQGLLTWTVIVVATVLESLKEIGFVRFDLKKYKLVAPDTIEILFKSSLPLPLEDTPK